MLCSTHREQRICSPLTPGVVTPGCMVNEIAEAVETDTAVTTDATHLLVISVMTGAENVETGRGTTDETTERRVMAMETGNENAAENAGFPPRKMFPRGLRWPWTTPRARAHLVAHATNAGNQDT